MAWSPALDSEVRGTGQRLVLAHGFGQNKGCWGGMAESLADRFETVLVDLPGHGKSGDDQADLATSADLLIGTGGVSSYVGYSMGGRVALQAAIAHPEHVQALVLVGASPGIEDEVERAERKRLDEERARRLLDIGLTDFLDEWLAMPLFAGLTAEMQFRDERLRNRPEGLAASLRRCGTGSQVPLWNRLDEIVMPVLLLAGSLDQKFTDLAKRMSAAIGANAQVVLLEDASHACHLERPSEAVALIAEFLDESS